MWGDGKVISQVWNLRVELLKSVSICENISTVLVEDLVRVVRPIEGEFGGRSALREFPLVIGLNIVTCRQNDKTRNIFTLVRYK